MVSNSLWPRGLYSPWNSPGQNTGVGMLSLLQGIFPTQVSCIACGFFTNWATREAQDYWSGQPIPSPVDLPNSGIKLGSPALQAYSLPTELSGKPIKSKAKAKISDFSAFLHSNAYLTLFSIGVGFSHGNVQKLLGWLCLLLPPWPSPPGPHETETIDSSHPEPYSRAVTAKCKKSTQD